MVEKELDVEAMEIDEPCCIANTGCEFKGNIDDVVGECIFVDKVYDSVVFNLQGLQPASKVPFGSLPISKCGPKSRIVKVLDIRAKKFFNPDNINDPRNLTVTPKTTLSGAQFVKDGKGNPVTVPGPAGILQFLVFADTSECDEEGLGTPIFGSQEINVEGTVLVEIDVLFIDAHGDKQKATLRGKVPVKQCLTNFFELCLPSVFDSAFLPQFTEFCNINFIARLATQSISRDIIFNPNTGEVFINLIIALCITCEKKIKVPVQLCVLSVGFCEQQPRMRPICDEDEFPPLFPPQVSEPFVDPC